MKFSTILVIGLILLTCVNTIVNASVLDNEHYIICGHVYEPYTHDTVMIENTRTSEVLEIKLQQFEPNKKEYQVTIANFELGWKWSDIVTITYGNQTLPIELIEGDIGAQIDFNRPTDIEPTTVLAGTILILSASGLYYRIIRKESKNLKGDKHMTENEQTDIVEKKDTPLGLPTGSIRAILAILGLIAMGVFEFYGKPMSGEMTTVIVALVMTFVGAHVPIIKK